MSNHRPALRHLARFVHAHSVRLLLALTVGLLVLCVAIKSAKFDAELSSWIQRTSRVDTELNYVASALGEGGGSTSELLLQTAHEPGRNVLTAEALMVHLEAMAIATHVTVDQFDTSWSLKDICFKASAPVYERAGQFLDSMLDNMMPCAIKTPLDCFWEGAKLHWDHQINMGSEWPTLRWTSMNPLSMVQRMQRDHPHLSFRFTSVLDWMQRVGISSGYLHKPCLDPTDPNCPETAPNRKTKELNIGSLLSNGCHGVAAKQMHWKEDEIVGGVIRNKSGQIVLAAALQSTVQLMDEQDLYNFQRGEIKVQNINNWSAEKAKVVLELWQRQFKEELAQFTRTPMLSSTFKVHAMTSKSMLEPIDIYSLFDFTNFELSFALMAIFTSFIYPEFLLLPVQENTNDLKNEQKVAINRFKIIILALVSSFFVTLTFIASLGISSFMNLPFNMATIQILPPLALYYGFSQNIAVANIYSQKLHSVPSKELTYHCLDEIIPIVTFESSCYVIALFVATMIPVQATRAFAFQAITYIVIATITAILVIPSILETFLILCKSQDSNESTSQRGQLDDTSRSSSRTGSLNKLKISKRSAKQTQSDDLDLEDQLFSRIQHDLKNIRAEPRQPTNINFSASLGVNGLRTSVNVTTSGPHEHSFSSNHQTNLNPPHPTVIKSQPKLQGLNTALNRNSLPDLITSSLATAPVIEISTITPYDHIQDEKLDQNTGQISLEEESVIIATYLDYVTSNRYMKFLICFLILMLLIILLPYSTRVQYGLQLTDIIAQDTSDYESFMIQEEYFPVYNVFAVTRGNFDYSTNQRLLIDYYNAFQQVKGVLEDDYSAESKFWLINFRNWLLEIQSRFDADRNKSLVHRDGWAYEASESAKLGYKLLVQTGRTDNPIDKGQVEFNRLVDNNGIINPKAFYHYLAAWIMNDPFTYTFSEANFKPVTKVWTETEDLRIEKARPLTFAQIPLLIKLPANHDSLKTISDMRSISQAFEQLNVPNFLTGTPFIFWDQFFNLDLMLLIGTSISLISVFIVIVVATSDMNIATIVTVPIFITFLGVYSFMGLMSIGFNNILAFLLISNMGISVIHTVPIATYFMIEEGDLESRTRSALRQRVKIVIMYHLLCLLCAVVFRCSNIQFMIKYSYVLTCFNLFSSLNSLFLTPILLSTFGSEYKTSPNKENHLEIVCTKGSGRRPAKTKRFKYKKRIHPKIKSETSLSTIAEEPQSDTHVHDLKFDLSIRCY